MAMRMAPGAKVMLHHPERITKMHPIVIIRSSQVNSPFPIRTYGLVTLTAREPFSLLVLNTTYTL